MNLSQGEYRALLTRRLRFLKSVEIVAPEVLSDLYDVVFPVYRALADQAAAFKGPTTAAMRRRLSPPLRGALLRWVRKYQLDDLDDWFLEQATTTLRGWRCGEPSEPFRDLRDAAMSAHEQAMDQGVPPYSWSDCVDPTAPEVVARVRDELLAWARRHHLTDPDSLGAALDSLWEWWRERRADPSGLPRQEPRAFSRQFIVGRVPEDLRDAGVLQVSLTTRFFEVELPPFKFTHGEPGPEQGHRSGAEAAVKTAFREWVRESRQKIDAELRLYLDAFKVEANRAGLRARRPERSLAWHLDWLVRRRVQRRSWAEVRRETPHKAHPDMIRQAVRSLERELRLRPHRTKGGRPRQS